MEDYQRQYIENSRMIQALNDYSHGAELGFSAWYQERKEQEKRSEALRQENIRLLNDHFFPVLDYLHDADEATLRSLEEFGEALMDWKNNLDCGLYVLIHDGLLSRCRVRKDRSGVIRELYKLGMGIYYQNKMIQGLERERKRSYLFQNELIFTEGGSYFKYFADTPDDETKGYIIRSLANIALCCEDRRRRVAVTSRILKILQDPYYRDLAPSLPWDVFLRKTHQQMSANRDVLSRGNFSGEELAEVLESCMVVFEPEKDNADPNVRWLWPYYEMQYSCGFASLETTLARMEELISSASKDRHDTSGLYAAVQLPIYYGRLLRDNPQAARREKKEAFLKDAYQIMMETVLSVPVTEMDDYFYYALNLIITDYYEIPCVETYRSVTSKLMRKFGGRLYIRSLRVSRLMEVWSGYILDEIPDFFDEIPFIREISDPSEKRSALMEYAGLCGLYHDFGLIKMNAAGIDEIRMRFEREEQLWQLHPASGYDDLKARASTEHFADTALGHHAWYSGTGGYPEEYVRTDSVYRAMTDVAAAAVWIEEQGSGNFDAAIADMLGKGRTMFSPIVLSFLNVPACREELRSILQDDETLYRMAYESLAGMSETA